MSASVPSLPSPVPSNVESKPEVVSTTTIFPNATAASTSTPSSGNNRSSTIPIAAIAGGAAAGVFLAVVAVLFWHWWGRSIKRKEDRERNDAFDFLQLRENTRRNASNLVAHHYSSYRPSFSMHKHERKVAFVPSSNGPMEERSSEKEKQGTLHNRTNCLVRTSTHISTSATTASANAPETRRVVRSSVPSPLSQRGSPPEEMRLPRPLARERAVPSDPAATNRRSTIMSLEAPSLVHKSSNVSSASIYSTQSGEERQVRAPPSLIMAAFGRLDPRRPLSANYRPGSGLRHSVNMYDDYNRLSQISAGSAYLQRSDDYSDVPVGYAT
ncbi:hypothetical protein PHLCEN_2v9314 [Hermanssonia centrifuga]|uniref:Uncharacterized protein n=1 Tax=Hermanssonia centrifuga TaxID=98765 RepID=A0A2R6NR59_9APHY|nr:hypothetical protein PHLCEN_2v9314 [Hermanssonia centrifuga]